MKLRMIKKWKKGSKEKSKENNKRKLDRVILSHLIEFRLL
jgi:hypothetical protein